MTERRFLMFNSALALAIGAAVCVGVRAGGRGSGGDPPEAAGTASAARPPVQVSSVAVVLRALKLITVEIATATTSESVDDSWRGDAEARVIAPVRLYYGVDLSDLDDASVRRDSLTGVWRVRVPTPRRLAVEVLTGDERASVRVSGTRLLDVAGEYHLGLARRRLHECARELALSPEQQALVERLTRVQIGALVRAVAGEAVGVEVDFERSERVAVDQGRAAAQGGR